MKADSGEKFDMGKVNRILAYVIDLDDNELGILIDRLRQEQHRRSKGRNMDTIQT